jgi:hypothetical protein
MGQLRSVGGVAIVALASVALGCNGSVPTSPTLVSDTARMSGSAADVLPESTAAIATATIASAPDGSTLKATAPVPQSPKNDVQIATLQPALTASNAVGRHVSPTAFIHLFEVWKVGSDGTTTLVDSDRVPQGTDTTSYTVKVALEPGETFEWRARAVWDGALGPWSEWARFRTPILLIFPPLPSEPIHGVTVGSLRPTLVLVNGEVEGPGVVTYEFQIATDSAFTNIVAIRAAERGTGPAVTAPSSGTSAGVARSHLPHQRTSVTLDFDLEPDTLYYWRGRGTNGPIATTPLEDPMGVVVTGAFSVVESFRTPRSRSRGSLDELDPSRVTLLITR